jgi:hypothetical protein
MKKISILPGILVLVLAACGSQAQAPASPTATPRPTQSSATPTTAPVGPLGAVGCKPASPMQPSGVGGPEFEGTSADASLWTLLFNPLATGQDIKMVWRMTGSGDLHVVALGPQGQQVQPDWGPEAHSGSNWQRPGAEWGTGFTFPAAGCWDMRATRENASGDVWLVIPG